MLSLPDVTLCAVTCVNHELTVRAINECLKHCTFADVVLVSDKQIDAPFRVEIVPHFRGEEYAPFICRNLTKYTPSSFNLLVQYDSHIVEPKAWTDRFLDYDYIGAKWPWQPPGQRVGNSGFCLRSKKLLDIMVSMPLPPTGEFVDDTLVSSAAREWFEKVYNIKVAPEDIADIFAYERHTPDRPTFGFHGIFNLWRHTDDAEMEIYVDGLDEFYVQTRAYVEVLLHYYTARKFPVFSRWFNRLHKDMGPERTREHLLSYVKDTVFIDQLMKIGTEAGALRG